MFETLETYGALVVGAKARERKRQVPFDEYVAIHVSAVRGLEAKGLVMGRDFTEANAIEVWEGFRDAKRQ